MRDTAADPAATSVGGTESAVASLARLMPWVARVAWLLTAVGGAAIEGALDGRSAAVRWVAAIGSWTIFGAVVAALLIPSTLSLTIARVVGPLSVVGVIGSAIFGANATDTALLAVPTLIANAALFSPEFARWMVQASSYGDEDRLPLRPPAAAGAASIVSWVIWAAAVCVGPLSLAASNWLVGVPATIVAVAASVYIGPRWFRMARRWLVLVPAGVVVHDPIVLADTLMVRTDQLAAIQLARADTDAADLTGPASGYAIEINTTESVSTVFAFTPKEPNGKAIHMTGFLVAPTRPGQALRRATERNLPVR